MTISLIFIIILKVNNAAPVVIDPIGDLKVSGDFPAAHANWGMIKSEDLEKLQLLAPIRW